MADQRLHSIYFHAGRLFNIKRYANTKVSEIAKASGVATGTIYNLFTSKKAILTFVIQASLDKNYLDGDIELPVEEADTSRLLSLWSNLYKRLIGIMQITNNEGKIIKGFSQMITELFDFLADILLGTGNIESNANILPELANAFFPARENFFIMMEEALNIYIKAGEVRKLEHTRIHVQSITDILTWWAMNAYIAMPDVSVPEEIAQQISVELIERAYLTDSHLA